MTTEVYATSMNIKASASPPLVRTTHDEGLTSPQSGSYPPPVSMSVCVKRKRERLEEEKMEVEKKRKALDEELSRVEREEREETERLETEAKARLEVELEVDRESLCALFTTLSTTYKTMPSNVDPPQNTALEQRITYAKQRVENRRLLCDGLRKDVISLLSRYRTHFGYLTIYESHLADLLREKKEAEDAEERKRLEKIERDLAKVANEKKRLREKERKLKALSGVCPVSDDEMEDLCDSLSDTSVA